MRPYGAEHVFGLWWDDDSLDKSRRRGRTDGDRAIDHDVDDYYDTMSLDREIDASSSCCQPDCDECYREHRQHVEYIGDLRVHMYEILEDEQGTDYSASRVQRMR